MKHPVEHRFAGPSGDLCWFEWGSAGAEPSLLFLHATGFHARCWDATIAALPSDLHSMAIDLCGHGRSYRPETLSDWIQIADDVAAFVAAQSAAPLFAVGHSMGGYVAARTAAVAPEKIAQLLLVDPVIMAPETYEVMGAPFSGVVAEHPVARRRNAWRSAEEMMVHFSSRDPYARWRPEVLADYCTFGLVPVQNGEGLELACPPLLEASAYMGSWRENPYDWVGEIRCPTLILRARTGERQNALDFSISPTNPQLASHFADARDLHWQDVSHFIPMEQPEKLAQLIVALKNQDTETI